MTRTHSLIFWVRAVHRWISMGFVVVAAVLLLGVAPLGTPVGDAISFVAISLLLLLVISGAWMAVHHYTAGARARRRRQSPTAAA